MNKNLKVHKYIYTLFKRIYKQDISVVADLKMQMDKGDKME